MDMEGPLIPVSAPWPALRGQFAGEALARILALCSCETDCRPRKGGKSQLLLTADGQTVPLTVGPVKLLWRGAPLAGEAPDWPQAVSEGAARFFLTSQPLAAPVELDFDLAARRDLDSPYYAAAYTHRRLRALLSRPEPEGIASPMPAAPGRSLALAVDRFPAAVRQAAARLDPCPVNRYAAELAAELRRFLYTVPLTGENHRLAQAAETALTNVLALLGGLVPFS